MRNLYLTVVLVIVAVAASASAAPVTRYADFNCGFNGDGTANQCATATGQPGAWNNENAVAACTGFDPAGGNKLQWRAGVHRITNKLALSTNCSGPDKAHQNIIEPVAGADVTLTGARRINLAVTPFVHRGNNEYECLTACSWDGSSTINTFPMTAFYQRSDATACSVDTDCGTNDDRCTSGKCEEHLFLWQERSSRGQAGGTQNYSCGTGQIGPGEMILDQGPAVMCVKLSDSSDPNNLVFFEHAKAFSVINFHVNGVDYIWLRSNPAGGHLTHRDSVNKLLTHKPSTKGLTIGGPGPEYGITAAWAQDRCIDGTGSDVTDTVDGHTIQWNLVHHCGQEGIRETDNRASGMLIANNKVWKIQGPDDFSRCSPPGSFQCLGGFSDGGSGIRVWDSHAGVVRDNEIFQMGGGKGNTHNAINVEGGGRNYLIENNYIHDNWSLPNPGANQNVDGHGFAFSGKNCTLPCDETYEGLTIRNNRIRNVGACFYWQGAAGLGGIGTLTNEIYNNTCTEFTAWGIHSFSGSWTSPWNFRNNIFSTTIRTPHGIIRTVSGMTGMVTPTFNSYFCPTCQVGQPLISYLGSTYDQDSRCTAGVDCVQDLDANSDYGDPNINGLGQILSASGFAYNKGSNTICPPFDYDGTARPQDTLCDNGADEFAGVPPSTTTTTTISGTTTTTLAPTTTTTTTLAPMSGVTAKGGVIRGGQIK